MPAKRRRLKGSDADNDPKSEAAGAVPEAALPPRAGQAVPEAALSPQGGQVSCSEYLWPKPPRILLDAVLLPGAPSLMQWQRRHPPPRPQPTHTQGEISGHTPRSIHGPPRESPGSLHGIPQGFQMNPRDPQGSPGAPRNPGGP